MTVIPSEAQAEAIGKLLTEGERDRDFVVFWYEQNRTKLTLFGVEIVATRKRIWHQ